MERQGRGGAVLQLLKLVDGDVGRGEGHGLDADELLDPLPRLRAGGVRRQDVLGGRPGPEAKVFPPSGAPRRISRGAFDARARVPAPCRRGDAATGYDGRVEELRSVPQECLHPFRCRRPFGTRQSRFRI